MTKLYVAGPMRGKPRSNWPAFGDATERLRRAGYEVLSPHEGSPTDDPNPPEDQYQQLVRRGVRMMLDCDGVAVLPGWEESNGASFEVDVARGAGKKVKSVAQWARRRDDVALPGDNELPLLWTGDQEHRPMRQYKGDAGFDLICSESTTIGYQQFKDVPCGISVEQPPGVWSLIIGRSSTLRKRELMVAPGIIDNGWRGELFAGVWNLGEKPTNVRAGERIAQLIPFPLVAAGLTLERVEVLSETDRGGKGFGSTGL